MLKSTFIHIPGIGYTTERKLWKNGIKDWWDFDENLRVPDLSQHRINAMINELKESKQKLTNGDHSFFAARLPSKEMWRAYREFIDSAVFLDIETTGLSWERSDITLIGLYDGENVKTYVKGTNMDEFARDIKNFSMIITFNGARFDLPFIRTAFPQVKMDQIHIDLMYPLRRIGLSGGLKYIEKRVGIERSSEVKDFSGFDAVNLWYKYERGDDDALRLLVEYNAEDIKNLKMLMELAYGKLKEACFGGL